MFDAYRNISASIICAQESTRIGDDENHLQKEKAEVSLFLIAHHQNPSMMNFDQYAQKGHEFIKIAAAELGDPDNTDKAGRIVRAVLHALRNRLSLQESFQLMAQLPMALQSVYVEGWDPDQQGERINHLQDFLEEIRNEDDRAGACDFTDLNDVESSAKAVFRTLSRYVSEGELQDVAAQLPKELKELIERRVEVEGQDPSRSIG